MNSKGVTHVASFGLDMATGDLAQFPSISQARGPHGERGFRLFHEMERRVARQRYRRTELIKVAVIKIKRHRLGGL